MPYQFSSILIPNCLDTSSADLFADFFLPMLRASVRYDRGVGFFSSGWLKLAAKGMIDFANNGGRARWVTSPILDENDWEAMQAGDEARSDDTLREALLREASNLAATLETKTCSALAWMIADEVLDFKLAIPRNKLDRGDFHDKFGIFTDTAGQQISFNGSYNDSVQGTRNYESLKIFKAWEEPFVAFVRSDVVRFERLWNNLDPNVRVYSLPEAARLKVLQLRETVRPYREPDWVRISRTAEDRAKYRLPHPALPAALNLREYQTLAIAAWFEQDCCGLLEMATGTGKTITALAASAKLFEREKRLAVIIAVPYQHLVDQWNDEAREFGYQPILAYQNTAKWLATWKQQASEYNAGYRGFVSIITTHTTFIMREFQQIMEHLQGPVLLIADEVHHLGAERSRQNYPIHIPFRLALSATPDRWFDDAGTEALRAYFGKTVFAFPLEKAIGSSLTPYYYYPRLVPLTLSEFDEYEKLSMKIARIATREGEDAQEAYKRLLIKRADLLNKAENKIAALANLIEHPQDIQHTLFYCAPGQIDAVQRMLGWEKGIVLNRFTAEESAEERQRILSDFANKNVQALVAMKCLDEGVDVPSTHTAYFLSSSSNPREFVQRRGRILRKAPGKEYAAIYDLIAIPPNTWVADREAPSFKSERSIMKRELVRFKEFANLALNKQQAIDVIWEIAKRYSLLDF